MACQCRPFDPEAVKGCDAAPLPTSAHEQVPGFFVFRVFGVLAVGGEEDVGLVVGGGEGEDVEDVWGDYVGGEEVDLSWGVGGAVAVDDAAVGIFLAALEGAFYLDAEEVAPLVAVRSLRAGYEEVVGGAVSAGSGED